MITIKRRLLLVDDDEMARDFMSIRLGRRGFDVTTAEDGFKALDLLQEKEFDLVLLDIMMPGISGLEVLPQIRKSFSMLALPVIMATADDQQECIIRALELGANDYLVKPINMEVALARINSQITLKHLDAVKDEFVSFASHDLKKPLMLMLDIAHELKKDFVSNNNVTQQAHDSLELILRTGENMQAVIDGFLNKETMRSGQIKLAPTLVDLNSKISQVLADNRNYALNKGIKLFEELQQGLPQIPVDAPRIREVLDNLIGNAIKFCPNGSSITVRSTCNEESVSVEVCDVGPGIKSEDMDKLFVKHAKLSNQPTGGETSSGIGLSICKQLIELHTGGRIGAFNNTDGGATFWFSLPRESYHRQKPPHNPVQPDDPVQAEKNNVAECERED